MCLVILSSPSVSLADIHSFDFGTPWQLEHTLLWNGIALPFLNNSCNSVLSRGTGDDLSTSNIDKGNTLKEEGNIVLALCMQVNIIII